MLKNDDLSSKNHGFDGMSNENIISAMTEQMISDGFFPDNLKVDGKWHRFRLFGGGKNNVDGAYVLSINGESATGCYYSYRKTDEKFHFHYGKKQTFIERFVSYPAADERHPYILKKQMPAAGFRQDTSGRLVVPMTDQTGECCGLQLISPDGQKTLVKGSIKAGSRLDIRGDETNVYICEGIATSFSVHQATGNKVIVAWDEGNLKNICQYVHEVYPNSKVIFAADNDTTSTPNIGVQSAKRAAAAIGATVIIPEMNGNKCDWNDIHCLLGLEEVERQLKAIPDEKPTQHFKFEDLTDWQLEAPLPIEYIYKNFLPRGIVGAVCARGGTGKSYLLEALTMTSILGLDCFRLFFPERPLRIIGLFVEDPAPITRTRLYDIGSTFTGNGITRSDLQTAMHDNLRLFCDNLGPLARYDGKGNPEATEAFKWLCDQVGTFDPDLIILDPKAQLYGLDENNNDHNTWWVNLLKNLNIYGASTIFSHHMPKGGDVFDIGALRGGGGLGDACRWAMGMQHLDPEKAKELGIDPTGYIHARMTKNSYSSRREDDFYFQHGDCGELYRVELKSKQTDEIAEMLIKELTAHYGGGGCGLTIRDIARDAPGKVIRENIKEKFFVNNSKIENLLQVLLLAKKIILVDEKRGNKVVQTVRIQSAQI